MSTEGRVVVVTGASGGIGQAICSRLVAEGYAIIAQYHRGEEKAKHLRDRVNDAGGHLSLVRADLREQDAVDRIAAEAARAEEDGLVLHGLVNNAAKLLSPSFLDTTPKDFDEYFAINVKAPLFLSQALMPRIRTGGAIVNVSSASAHFSSSGDLVYAMSKAALESLTVNMAEAIAPSGVRVNYVIPGFTNNGHRAFGDERVREYMSSFSVLGNVSQPADVAAGVHFLLSDESSRTTGTGLDVSGGSTLGARGRRENSVSALLDREA
ncbi:MULTISPECIES: SDR family NAD(P)-dependent oxidoreductase [unclassified Brevibacterium]|uniref:SDR family NAD(P)-dependent oxidoreductase n=1 Tax=unclassified Brevibacterium TaxID=2614124 RepID=UPI0008A61C49|nr:MULTISPECIES: SDR family oxidoreductase [unclassified Brevibacterium]OFL64794.1 hypothetical protein HMPREF2757_05850 [Brevibacterium sp. HMSC063G07]OFS26536.1 hypothetical protein HMPREF3162_05185 [Brevibacterium sp. HMSC07C04]